MILLVDSHSLIHRSYHAYPPLHHSKTGEQLNAVFGTFSFILNEIKLSQPEHVFVTADLPGGNFRHELDENYKGTRSESDKELVEQLISTKDYLQDAGFNVYCKQGFEADDIIGTFAKRYSDHRIIILSSDMDLLQLVNDNTFVKVPGAKGKYMHVTDVFDKWSILPEQVPTYKGLVGDASDNIKGVKGVGPKSASMLIQKYETLDNIYNSIDDILKDKKSLGQKLLEGKDEAYHSEKLATIHCDVEFECDLEKARVTKNLQSKIHQKLQELEFNSLQHIVNNFTTYEPQENTLF